MRTEAIGQSGLNDGRSVDAAEVWIADDRNDEVSSVRSDANAFATVHFGAVHFTTVNFKPLFDEMGSDDTAGYRAAGYQGAAGYQAATVASTIGASTIGASVIEPAFAGRDRDSFWAALRGSNRLESGSSEDSEQRAAQNPGIFGPGCSHIRSRHRFS